jgi:ribonuclease I
MVTLFIFISLSEENFVLGSCYYTTATDYFTTIEYLFNQLNIPDIRTMKQPTFSSIKNAFLKLNSPELFPSAINVYMDKQGRLDEIRICYDLQYKFISCRQ